MIKEYTNEELDAMHFPIYKIASVLAFEDLKNKLEHFKAISKKIKRKKCNHAR
jgi:hypothetical protein